jgi:hypothetical protein
MRNYKTVTEYPVKMSALRESLCGNKHKLPKHFSFEGEMLVQVGYFWRQDLNLISLKVKVIPAIKQGKPRVFIFNTNQNKWVPAGRTAQAKF